MKPIKLSPWQRAAIEWALEPTSLIVKKAELPRIVDGCLVLSDSPAANNALMAALTGNLIECIKGGHPYDFPEKNADKRFEILKAKRLAERIEEVRNRNTIRLKLGAELLRSLSRLELPVSDASSAEQSAFAFAIHVYDNEPTKRIVVLELGGDAARYMHSRIDAWIHAWQEEQTQYRARSEEYHERRLWILSCIRLKQQLAGFLGITS